MLTRVRHTGPTHVAVGQHKPRLPVCDMSKVNTSAADTTYTDTHIRHLRIEITNLTDEVASPLTPTALRERLKQRITALQRIVDRHEQTKIVPMAVEKPRQP
jgi:hypothetical protein